MLITPQTPVVDLRTRVSKDHYISKVDLSSPFSKPLPVIANLTAPPRTKGLHLSGIIRPVAFKYRLLKPKTHGQQKMYEKEQEVLRSLSSFGGGGTGDILEEDLPIIMALGCAWEDWLSRQYREMIYHPGEWCVDGIYMSPDGWTPYGGGIYVDEIKFTYKSMNTPFEFMHLYHLQGKSYCRALETNFIRYHVLYANGNYSDLRGPRYIIYDVTYTQQELDDNWDFILRHKQLGEPEV
jgi:hypothetical protein